MNETIKPDLSLVMILAGLAGHYNKHYCYPTQDKICSLLKRYYGRFMSRRTVNRHLAGLEAAGWIRRRRRHQLDKVRGWVFRSTLYTITNKARRCLGALRGFIGGLTGPTRSRSAPEPCANNGTIFYSSSNNHGGSAPSGTDPPQASKVATENVALLKEITRNR